MRKKDGGSTTGNTRQGNVRKPIAGPATKKISDPASNVEQVPDSRPTTALVGPDSRPPTRQSLSRELHSRLARKASQVHPYPEGYSSSAASGAATCSEPDSFTTPTFGDSPPTSVTTSTDENGRTTRPPTGVPQQNSPPTSVTTSTDENGRTTRPPTGVPQQNSEHLSFLELFDGSSEPAAQAEEASSDPATQAEDPGFSPRVFQERLSSTSTVQTVTEEDYTDSDEDWEGMVIRVMGLDEGYGYYPEKKRFTDISEEEAGDTQSESGDNDDAHSDNLGTNGPIRDLKSQTTGIKYMLTRTASYENSLGKLRAASKAISLGKLLSRSPSSESTVSPETSRNYIAYIMRLSISWKMLLARFCFSAIHPERNAQQLTSILVTAEKRLELDAKKSSKRVHFKLRKNSEIRTFRPLHPNNSFIQMWLRALLCPIYFDIILFGLRIAFCDVYTKQNLLYWYLDIVIDLIWGVGDMCVSLITIVPKGFYPEQKNTAYTFREIAKLYWKHRFVRDVGPLALYQVCSLILFLLPHDDDDLYRWEYFWVWVVSMAPRFGQNFYKFFNYFHENVINPKIVANQNLKRFQYVKIFLILFMSAHLIGCVYFFFARIQGFESKQTWLHAFEQSLPYYEYNGEAAVSEKEYLLIIFKGFCRLAEIDFDPGMPDSWPEMILSIFVIFLSVSITSMIVGNILTFLVRRDPMEVAHKERIENLRKYMTKKNVPADMYESVMRYCQFQYRKNMSSGTSDRVLIKSLSRSLRIEVANAYHQDLLVRCSKIGRPLHKCSHEFLNELAIKLYTVHVMPGDYVVHKDEIPRELYFVSLGAVQIVDEHDQVVSVIRSDVPDTAPIVGEVPFFLGINYLKAIKASLEGDVQLQVLNKQSLSELTAEFPEDHNIVCQNLGVQFDIGTKTDQTDDENYDQEKLLTKKRILESQNFRTEQQFNALCRALKVGDVKTIEKLSRQGANLNQSDYDGRTIMHMACSSGRYKVVECLIKLQVDINSKDRWGQTPMAIAIQTKQQMIVSVLASAKAQLALASPELVLCTAAGSGDLTQVKRLIEFKVAPNIGDYDSRTALHVASAEGHEKLVEYLLLSHADPNCKDRWGGTPLQDALANGHIGTAHILKAKGALVPEAFGSGAVCSAAGKGDVPKLRMLHSFGQSLDVGDYDDRYALHLASAEARVLAVSFLLGISSDPSVLDRWGGTPMDDCIRGGTLYHKYCAKLLQGWGGELGTFKDTKVGDKFLADLNDISIKNIREVIRKLIDQGLDKECPERMDDNELLVVMTATIRHMPLVTQLHSNTAVITKEIRHFRTVVHTFVYQIRNNLEIVLDTLLKGTRRVPEFENSILDDVRVARKRPSTSKLARPKTRSEIHRKIDSFSGIQQEDNVRLLDSLMLESPMHSHEALWPPRRMVRLTMNGSLTRSLTRCLSTHVKDMRCLSEITTDEDSQSENTSRSSYDDKLKLQDSLEQRISKALEFKKGLKTFSSRSMTNIFQRSNQKTDALIKTLYDPTVPPVTIRECFRMLKRSDKKRYMWLTEATEGFLDSDEEESLHCEIDNITAIQEAWLMNTKEDWWEKEAARLFNSIALQIVTVESAFSILQQVLCSSLPAGLEPDADPMLGMESVARALVSLRAHIDHLDLDKIVEEVHHCIKPFRLLLTPKARRSNTDAISGIVRFSTLVAASSIFRNAILSMDVDKTLCVFCKSCLAEVFREHHAKILLPHARLETKRENEILLNNSEHDDKYFTLVISGEIAVIRTLDDVEIGRGKCTVGCYFGAYRALVHPLGVPDSEKETPVKEGGSGINNCVIKAAAKCQVLRISIANLREVLSNNQKQQDTFKRKLVENIASNISNLEKLNSVIIESNISFETSTSRREDWMLQPASRTYYVGAPEIERQEIQCAFQDIQHLWHHLSRGAKTAPKGTVDIIKEFLGESGSECYDKVFAPMNEPTAPSFLDVETFWFCWIHFLTRSQTQDAGVTEQDQGHEENDESVHGFGVALDAVKGAVNITLKNALNLLPMDTFTGKADPYVMFTVDGISQKSQVRSGTLEPIWNQTMQFNAFANHSIVRGEVFDHENMGADRLMGTFSFVVPNDSIRHTLGHKLQGALPDGRMAEGIVSTSFVFIRGARQVQEQKSEFELFCETENLMDWFRSLILKGRRIENAFFKMPLPVHEREFIKAVGSLSVPLTGLAIKQYLTYLLVEHSHQVDVYCCREFCGFFKRKLNNDTSIMYRDIVKLVKERNMGVSFNDLFIGTALNPNHKFIVGCRTIARVVSLYHLIMVPVRIAFNTSPTFYFSFFSTLALSTDLPADCYTIVYLFLSFNISYKNSKSQWITSRYRIAKKTEWIIVFAVVPFDWIVFLSGLDPESALWCRINKMLLYFSIISPRAIIFSARGNSIADSVVFILIIVHIAACLYFYLGRAIPTTYSPNQSASAFRTNISWSYAPPDSSLNNWWYNRTEHFAMRPSSNVYEKWMLCVYWVLSTLSAQGVIGDLSPQNFDELLFVMVLVILNVTFYIRIQAEISNMFMSIDDTVIRTREEQDRILKFVSVTAFSPALRERIQAHFLAVQGNMSEDQEKLLMTLSHGLRVQLARFVWCEFLGKVYLFRGCSGNFIDALSVLVQETHFGPEEILEKAGQVCDSLVILVSGALETYSNESDRVKKLGRKGHAVSPLSFFFGIRQFLNTRAARSGAICVRVKHEGMKEVLQIYPKDEEVVRKNALNFYMKEKQSEGSVAFSLTSSNATEEGSDDSGSTVGSKGTHKTHDTHKTNESGKSSATAKSTTSRDSKGSKNSISKNSVGGSSKDNERQSKKKSKKVKVTALKADEGMGMVGGMLSDDGSNDEGDDNGEKTLGPAAPELDEENMPLMKENEHIPNIKEQLIEEKIASVLTASARGDLSAIEAILNAGDITCSSKDGFGRTPLHVAASEGRTNIVEYLMHLKADPTAKDKFGNTPFNDAVRAKHDDVVAIIKKFDPDISFKLPGNELGVQMCQAAYSGKLEDIKRLVKNGVDPNESDYDGRTALHLAASEGNMEILKYLVSIRANITCRDRFNGTPLEDAVRHHFDLPHMDKVQDLLREHGATLAGEGLSYVIKMCEYAAQGNVERIRLLAINGVDVSLGDYDLRTPLHLAACNGNTAVLEYLLQQDSVIVNAVDRFGGTPHQDALRHGRKGAAAMLEEASGVRAGGVLSQEMMKQMIESSNQKKEERLKAEREPKIGHVLENSQESKMVATISDKLSKQIAQESAAIELIAQRMIWAMRGFGDRLLRNSCNIPFEDRTFVQASLHLLELVNGIRTSVNLSRSSLMAEMQGDEGAADCLIWRNASKEYKAQNLHAAHFTLQQQALELDDHMRELIMVAKAAKRMLKEVLKVCRRGQRQHMYTAAANMHDLEIRSVMAHTVLTPELLLTEERKKTAVKKSAVQQKVKKKWGAMRTIVHFGSRANLFGSRPNLLEESKNDLEPRKSNLTWGGFGRTLSFPMGRSWKGTQIQNSVTVVTGDQESKNDLEPRKSKLAWGGLGKMLKFRGSFTMGRPLQNVETFGASLDRSKSAPTDPSFSAGVTSVHSNSITGAVVKEDINP